jgi:hypothetical protein
VGDEISPTADAFRRHRVPGDANGGGRRAAGPHSAPVAAAVRLFTRTSAARGAGVCGGRKPIITAVFCSCRFSSSTWTESTSRSALVSRISCSARASLSGCRAGSLFCHTAAAPAAAAPNTRRRLSSSSCSSLRRSRLHSNSNSTSRLLSRRCRQGRRRWCRRPSGILTAAWVRPLFCASSAP